MDVGAVVYHLSIISCIIDDFTVERYLPKLEDLQLRLDVGKELAFSIKVFMMLARNL